MLTAPGPARGSSVAYNDDVVRKFAIMTIVWGIVGMPVGVIIAAELVWPTLNLAYPGSATAGCGRCTPTR